MGHRFLYSEKCTPEMSWNLASTWSLVQNLRMSNNRIFRPWITSSECYVVLFSCHHLYPSGMYLWYFFLFIGGLNEAAMPLPLQMIRYGTNSYHTASNPSPLSIHPSFIHSPQIRQVTTFHNPMDRVERDDTPAEEWTKELNAVCNRLSMQYLSLLRTASSVSALDKNKHDPRSTLVNGPKPRMLAFIFAF